MWWECNDCGGLLRCVRPPCVCTECGTAGVSFVAIDHASFDGPDDDLRSAWLHIGLDRLDNTSLVNAA
jgi:hypothetical protein